MIIVISRAVTSFNDFPVKTNLPFSTTIRDSVRPTFIKLQYVIKLPNFCNQFEKGIGAVYS